MRMCEIGLDEFSLGHRQSCAVQLDRQLSKSVSVDRGVTPDQAIGAHNASLDSLAGLHDREQRDHAAQRKIDPLDRLSRLGSTTFDRSSMGVSQGCRLVSSSDDSCPRMRFFARS
jgi:hypothetical protein